MSDELTRKQKEAGWTPELVDSYVAERNRVAAEKIFGMARGNINPITGGAIRETRIALSEVGFTSLLKEKRVLSKAKLVHGLVDGQGPAKGTRFGHAWVEADGMAYDFSNRRKIVHVGNDSVSYTKRQALRHVAFTRHYGPWDERFEV